MQKYIVKLRDFMTGKPARAVIVMYCYWVELDLNMVQLAMHLDLPHRESSLTRKTPFPKPLGKHCYLNLNSDHPTVDFIGRRAI